MGLRRAFIDDDRLARAAVSATTPLPEAVAWRLRRVLRLDDGAGVELFDDDGRVVRGRLLGDALVVDTVDALDDALPPLVVLQAVTKADKLELVLQKATELGASRVVLFPARRSQMKLGGKGGDDERADKKLVRFERIAQDAARQCGRARPPVVEAVKDGAAAVAVARAIVDGGGVAVAGVVDAESTLSAFLEAARARLDRGVAVVVGPEGGLDPQEQQAFADAGVTAVRWSRFVLRTETAALAALAIVQAALSEA
jgi:16S rRNA (uracil1498-N3)-methyltransferase